MSRKTTTAVITDRSQVPAGYCRIRSVCKNEREETMLSHAHLRGAVRAVKLMVSPLHRTGPVWVERASAEALLAEYRRFPDGDASDPAPPIAPPAAIPISAAAPADYTPVLERICVALERIAAAAEESWFQRANESDLVS